LPHVRWEANRIRDRERRAPQMQQTETLGGKSFEVNYLSNYSNPSVLGEKHGPLGEKDSNFEIGFGGGD